MTEIPADSLEARVAAAASAEERAALLGLDFARLVNAHRSLNWFFFVTVGTFTLAIVLPLMVRWSLVYEYTPFGVVLHLALGMMIAIVLLALALILPLLLLALPLLRDRSTRSKQLFQVVLSEVLSVVACVITAQLGDSVEWLAGMLIGAATAQLLVLSGHLGLKPAIVKNTKQQIALAQGAAEGPDWLAPTRGPLRWLFVAVVAAMFSITGTVLLVWSVPFVVPAVVVLLVAVAVIGLRAVWANSPRLFIWVQVGGAAVLLAAGLAAFLPTL